MVLDLEEPFRASWRKRYGVSIDPVPPNATITVATETNRGGIVYVTNHLTGKTKRWRNDL